MMPFGNGRLLGLHSEQCAAWHTVRGGHQRSRSPVHEHRESLISGFSKRYRLKMLVYFERHDAPELKIQREKNIKHWPRAWKVNLIIKANVHWDDLYETLT